MIIKDEKSEDLKKTLRVQQSSFDNWESLSMIALRNISCLARTNFNSSSSLIENVKKSYTNESSSDQITDKEMTDGSPDNILEWFKNVYLPLRLLERNSKIL